MSITETLNRVRTQLNRWDVLEERVLDTERVVFEHHPLTGQYKVSQVQHDTGKSFQIYHGDNAELAVHLYNRAGDPNWDRMLLTYRMDNNRRDDKKLMVFAVGATIPDCLAAFANNVGCTLDAGSVKIDAEPTVPDTLGAGNFQWSARFAQDGDGMKAAGVYVPGGVVMTWWK